MSHFQIFGFLLLGCLIVVNIVRVLHNRATWRSSAVWCALWLLAAIAIWKPDLTTRLASVLGIGRGADLVFYCAILGMFTGFFWVYLRLRQLDANLTLLTRALALAQARNDEPTPSVITNSEK